MLEGRQLSQIRIYPLKLVIMSQEYLLQKVKYFLNYLRAEELDMQRPNHRLISPKQLG